MVITITLPADAEILIKPGESVNFGDKLYQIARKNNLRVDIAKKLKIAPDKIFNFVIKVIGEEVKKGELLAQKKGFLTTKKVFSPVAATIREINHRTGEIILTTTDQSAKKSVLGYAFFRGKVLTIDNDLLKVDIEGGTPYPLRSVNNDGGGELFYFLDEAIYFTADENRIKDKIIVFNEAKPHIVVKCDALGCAGFLFASGEMESDQPSAILEKKEDFDKLVAQKLSYALFSKHDRSVIVYD